MNFGKISEKTVPASRIPGLSTLPVLGIGLRFTYDPAARLALLRRPP